MIVSGKKLLLFLFFAISIFFSFTHTTLAASLNFSPSSGSYKVGDTVTVRIVLSSSDQSVNAVSGTVSFSNDILSLTSISKTNSVIKLWVTEPAYSNTDGTANVEGVILNGFQGSDSTVATLSFRAKNSGNASIRFTSSSVLANDGAGSEILSGTGKANFYISPLQQTSSAQPASNAPTPIITDYSKDLKEGDFLVVKGLSDPSTDILITSEGILSPTYENQNYSTVVTSDDKGIFTYTSEKMKIGTYIITAQARDSNGNWSEKSTPVRITVSSEASLANLPNNSFSTELVRTLYAVIPIIALTVLLILMIIWGLYSIFHYKQGMSRKLTETKMLVSKSFDILDDDIKEQVRIFKKIKALKPLSEEEQIFIEQFKNDIEEAGKTIINKIKK